MLDFCAGDVLHVLHVAQQHAEVLCLAVELEGDNAVLIHCGNAEHIVALAVANLCACLIGKLENVQGEVLAVIVIRLLVVRADGDDGVLSCKERQREEIVVLAQPVTALALFVREQVRPLALRQVVRDVAFLREDRRDHQAVAEHILAVEVFARDVIREFQNHGTHGRHARFMCIDRSGEHVRHQGALEFGELTDNGYGFLAVLFTLLAEQPRHTVGIGAVQSGMRGEQAERRPALVNVRRSLALETAHVVAPEAEAGKAQGKAAAQGFGHGGVVRRAVAAPVYRELLSADRGASCKEACLVLALVLFKHFPNALIVKVGVIVVHTERIAAVVVDNIGRDSLTEVGLEAIDALVEQVAQLGLIPLPCTRVREVHDTHAGLPQIPLPNVAVRLFEEVAKLLRFLKQRRLLADIGVDPNADLEVVFVLHHLQLVLDIREHGPIPVEVAPFVFLHPVAVEVEHVQRNVALFHAVYEAHDGLFVVLRCEGGGEPQAECPCRRQCGLAGKRGVVFEHVFHAVAANDHEVELFARHGELYARDMLGADLIGDRARVVHEHAVVAVRDVERNALVRNFGAGAAVFVPGLHGLAVLHIRGEALAEAIDLFADVKVHLGTHVVAVRSGDGADHRVAEAVADACQLLVLIVVIKAARVLADDELCVAALDRHGRFGVLDLQCAVCVVQLERRHFLVAAHKVVRFRADDIRLRRGNVHFQKRAAHGAHVCVVRHGVEVNAVVFCLDFANLHGVRVCHAGKVHPVAFRKFHIQLTAFQKNSKIPLLALALFVRLLYHKYKRYALESLPLICPLL